MLITKNTFIAKPWEVVTGQKKSSSNCIKNCPFVFVAIVFKLMIRGTSYHVVEIIQALFLQKLRNVDPFSLLSGINTCQERIISCTRTGQNHVGFSYHLRDIVNQAIYMTDAGNDFFVVSPFRFHL